MAESLPYLASPVSLDKCLAGIASAATPTKVTSDFITAKLSIRGGTGRALVPFLKKIGFVNSDGTPTEIYRKFRNPATAKPAVAEAIKIGYKPIFEVNEYAHSLSEDDLTGLIVQVTGLAPKSQVTRLTVRTLNVLKERADFDEADVATETSNAGTQPVGADEAGTRAVVNGRQSAGKANINLSYTINLNLPATSEVEVFDAIFRSLKEHLLDHEGFQ